MVLPDVVFSEIIIIIIIIIVIIMIVVQNNNNSKCLYMVATSVIQLLPMWAL